MRKLIIAALAAGIMVPSVASAQTRELHRDRQEVQRDLRKGDYREAREDRRELKEDWREYRARNAHAFHRGAWNAPRGYRYQPVRVGVTLGVPFRASNYWINDPYTYRLPQAAYGTRYVRYGNDVLLINARTGRVLQVYSRLFY